MDRASWRPIAQRVFDRFVRLEGARSRPGSGLGLSLAAAAARMHGGTVRLEENSPGLKVVVTLPARPRRCLAACRRRRRISAPPCGSPASRTAARGALAQARRRLKALSREPAGRAAALIGAQAVRELLLGVADHSPYLWSADRRGSRPAARLLGNPPEARSTGWSPAIVGALRRRRRGLMRALRRAKRKSALLIALADLGGVWDAPRRPKR